MKKNILLVCLFLFSGQLIFSQSAWQWVNPETSFVTIRDASSTGVEGVVYFCGDGGVLLKSTNFGNTFSVENVPSHIRYTSISFANQNTGYLAGYDMEIQYFSQKNIYLLKTTNGGGDWFLQYQFTHNSKYNVTTPSPDRIYLYSTGPNNSGSLMYSTNGGDSFINLNNFGYSQSLKFVNDQTGFALINNRTIMKISEGGFNQVGIYSYPTQILFAIDFLNENTGFAVGSTGKIIKTSNGGVNWTDVSITENKKFTTVKIFNQSIIYAATDDGSIYKTNNGGSSWILQTTGSPNISYKGLIQLDNAPNHKIFAFGELGNIFANTLITTNNIWEKLTPPPHLSLIFTCRLIDFVNNNTGYVLFENGIVMRTTNAGLNFVYIHHPAGNLSMNALKFMNQNTGLIAGGSGFILRTGNGGITWTTVSSNQSYWILDLDIVSDDVYASASNGILRRSTNTGLAWHTVANPANEQIYTVKFTDQNTGFIGEYKIYKTTDKGITWTEPVISPLLTQQTAFHKINFLNSTTGYAAAEVVTGGGGRVYKTTNGGDIWYRILSHNTAIYNVKFKDENTGYATGAAAHVYKTTNSGVNWQIVYSNEFNPGDKSIWLHALDVTQNDVVLTGGTYGALLGTNLGNTVGIQNNTGSELPLSFQLHQNYPNPFNPVTNIKFSIPKSSFVTLKVFDITGREIAMLVNESLSAGEYEYRFDADEFNLSSGVYFYRMSAGEFLESKKLLLIK